VCTCSSASVGALLVLLAALCSRGKLTHCTAAGHVCTAPRRRVAPRFAIPSVSLRDKWPSAPAALRHGVGGAAALPRRAGACVPQLAVTAAVQDTAYLCCRGAPSRCDCSRSEQCDDEPRCVANPGAFEPEFTHWSRLDAGVLTGSPWKLWLVCTRGFGLAAGIARTHTAGARPLHSTLRAFSRRCLGCSPSDCSPALWRARQLVGIINRASAASAAATDVALPAIPCHRFGVEPTHEPQVSCERSSHVEPSRLYLPRLSSCAVGESAPCCGAVLAAAADTDCSQSPAGFEIIPLANSKFARIVGGDPLIPLQYRD